VVAAVVAHKAGTATLAALAVPSLLLSGPAMQEALAISQGPAQAATRGG